MCSKEVLHEKDNIDDGIGTPDWRLSIALLVSWLIVFLVVIRGVKSSGKAAYFLAIFPYVVLIVLLVRAVTLNGSLNGILYFITPIWQQLLTPIIWYHAVAQCFFSLTVCFGAVVMFASHNKFYHNVYRSVVAPYRSQVFARSFVVLIIHLWLLGINSLHRTIIHKCLFVDIIFVCTGPNAVFRF